MKIYAGQTLEGTMVFTDDDGSVITDFSQMDIKLLVKNRFDDYYILLGKADMNISGELVKFSIPPEKTEKLRISALIEMKVISAGKTRIAKKELCEVEDNSIKDL